MTMKLRLHCFIIKEKDMKDKILLVEDELGIANMEKNYLKKANFDVDIALDGESALKLFDENEYDLVILDLMLPKVSGEEILKYIREQSSLPVILVTAKVQEKDIIKGFRNGADDYIKKPFSGLELVERAKAVLRRSNENRLVKTDILETRDKIIKIDFANNRVLKNDEELAVTKNELLILKTLFSNPNKTFTRDEIIDLAFGMDYDAYDRAIDTHIKNIRQKIEEDPKKPKYIKTVYGIGYKAGGLNEIKD